MTDFLNSPFLIPIALRLREGDGDFRADAERAFERDLRMAALADVLDDRKPQSRAAGRLAAALVHAVEPLEDAALVKIGRASCRERV